MFVFVGCVGLVLGEWHVGLCLLSLADQDVVLHRRCWKNRRQGESVFSVSFHFCPPGSLSLRSHAILCAIVCFHLSSWLFFCVAFYSHTQLVFCFLSLSLSLSHTHTHTHTLARCFSDLLSGTNSTTIPLSFSSCFPADPGIADEESSRGEAENAGRGLSLLCRVSPLLSCVFLFLFLFNLIIIPLCVWVHACACVCVFVKERRKIELTVWGKKMPIALDGIRTCISGIRTHSASDCTTTAGTSRVSRMKHFRRSPVSSISKQSCKKDSNSYLRVCVCVCACMRVCLCLSARRIWGCISPSVFREREIETKKKTIFLMKSFSVPLLVLASQRKTQEGKEEEKEEGQGAWSWGWRRRSWKEAEKGEGCAIFRFSAFFCIEFPLQAEAIECWAHFELPGFGTILTLYRPISQLPENVKLAFALKEQYLNNYKRYHHDRHTVGKVFSLRIRWWKV